MIKAVSYWCTEGGLAGTNPIHAAAASVREAGFDGIELAIADAGVLHVESTEAECRELAEQVKAAGLTLQTAACGLSWAKNPASDDAEVRRQSIDTHARALQRTAWLGCDAMLMVPGVVTSPIAPDQCVRYDVAVDRVREAVGELLKTAEDVGVDLCIENVWNGLFLSPIELRDFVDSFDSDRLGVYFDVGNLLRYHQHPPHWIELLGQRIKRVHIKEFNETFGFVGGYMFSDLLNGQVPWAATMQALREVGYDRTIVAEMLPHDPGVLARTSAAMDVILAM